MLTLTRVLLELEKTVVNRQLLGKQFHSTTTNRHKIRLLLGKVVLKIHASANLHNLEYIQPLPTFTLHILELLLTAQTEDEVEVNL
jgi:hypothetical protein